MKTDEELMAAYLEGDDTAFRQLFERYSERLLRLMHRTMSDPEDARDLVQQTFLQLHRARADFDTDAKVRPWLYTIAMNLRRDYHRRRGRNREMLVDQMPVQSRAPREIEHLADAEVVRMAMAELSEKRRAVIELHWFEEFTFPEIADTLGIGKSAAKVRAHRAYKQMREFLSKKGM